MPEQTCALRALSSGDQVGDCLALPCVCDVERQRLEELAEAEHRRMWLEAAPDLEKRYRAFYGR